MLLLLLLLRCVRGRPSWHSAEATPAETRLHAPLQARRREIWKEDGGIVAFFLQIL